MTTLLESGAGGQQATAIQLREFQQTMINDTYTAIAGGISRILAIATTGAGKTVYASWMIRDAVRRGRRVLFLVDLDCLVGQTQKSLARLGVPSTQYKGSAKYDPACPVVVASCQTLDRRLGKKAIALQLGEAFDCAKKLIIADEAHDLYGRKCVWELQRDYPTDIHIGLTATPWRAKKSEYLGQLYDHVVLAPQAPDLIKMGLSVPCRGFSVDGVLDTTQLERNGYEYDIKAQERMSVRLIALETVVKEWVRLGQDRPTAAYTVSVEAARALADRFNALGIAADYQHGETDIEERERHNEALETGKIKVLASVGTLTKGWDLPSCGTVLFLRETTSKSLFFQAAGRASRILTYHHPSYPEGKNYYNLLDFGTNLNRFGSPSDIQDYYIGERGKGGETATPQKPCPECECLNWGFAKTCTNCGYVFPVEEKDDSFSESQLLEWFSPHQRKQVIALRDALRMAYKARTSPINAINDFVSVHRFVPPPEWARGAVLGERPLPGAQKEYLAYLQATLPNMQNIKHFARLEFGEPA